MKYDLAVIGGGPAGLMAALRASEAGAKVILLEKNERLGIKLLITGGGRCNITNNIPDYRLMAKNFGVSSSFLLSAFSRFGVIETMDFFESRGVKLKTEINNKVFPVSNQAIDILNLLKTGIKAAKGEIKTGACVSELIAEGNKIKRIVLQNKKEIFADNFLIATGGLSYQATGSSGDGYKWLKELGHTIKPTRPSLAPILVREDFIKNLEGLSLEEINLNLYLKNKKIAQERGSIIFTSLGVSGPAALNISRFIDLGLGHDFQLEIDFFPNKDSAELDKELIGILGASNKFLKNNLEELLPPRLVDLILFLSEIYETRMSNSLSRVERKVLVKNLKSLKLSIKSIEGYDRAMVTVGGVDLKEVDSKTMCSKIITNLFLAGEILDIAGPTGGYNLQAALSTGWAAGGSIKKRNAV